MSKKRIIRYTLFLCILSTLYVTIVKAENLDTSFGQGLGYVTTQNSQGVQINSLCIQSDGKIVAVGQTQASNTQAIIVRYTAQGVLDSTFGTGGIVTASAGSSSSTTVLTSVAMQSNGSIVVVGYTYDNAVATQVLIARYTTAGVLDTTFGSGGLVAAAFGSGSTINSVIIDGLGNIIVAGVATINNIPNGLIARLTTTGALDTTFGSGGSVFGLVGIRTGFNSAVFDGSGNIVVVGYAATVAGQQGLVTRFTASGVLDTTFGSGGIVTALIGTATTLNGLAITTSGTIVVAGFATANSVDQFLIGRYTASGVLDTTFGTGGSTLTALGNASRINAVALQTNGKIVAAGYANNATLQGALARYTSAGLLDSTFANAGSLLLNIGIKSLMSGIAVQTDGRIVAGGAEIDTATNLLFGLVVQCNKNNTDFVSITSITTPAITTKIPTISGSSSALNASVQVYLNGVLFATVPTDGSGNWTAGSSTVLPIGVNTIQAVLLVAGVNTVAREISFTVVDTFAEDSLFAYDTTIQPLTVLSNITFNTNAQIGTWSHTPGSALFTCNKAGIYEIDYLTMISEVATAASFASSMRLVKNGVEIPGSQTANSLTLSSPTAVVTITAGSTSPVTNSVITVLAAGDVIMLQALGSNAQLAPAGSGTTRPSAGMVITRIA